MAAKLKREELQRVRDHIASIPAGRFAMETYFGARHRNEDGTWVMDSWATPPGSMTNRNATEGSCGSCACIAGHALAVLAPDELVPDNPMDDAQTLLGLTMEQAGRLFEPHRNDRWFEDNRDLQSVTTTEAVAVLDHLLATGRVSWREALRKAAKAEA